MLSRLGKVSTNGVDSSDLLVFGAGFFFGGAVDHLIVSALRKPFTPYGVGSTPQRNVAFAALDLAMTLWLLGVATQRRLARPSNIVD
jgi:hypothetical protein